MKAIITVLGKDTTGIIAAVSALLAKRKVNIMDISQTTMQDLFTMIMLVSLKDANVDFATLSKQLKDLELENKLEIRIQQEDVFNYMHKV